jgi:mono/diheme cytochrome c family protein
MFRKLLLGLLGLGVIGGGGIVTGALMRYDRQREAPMPAIEASDDPAVIERGKYLVWGPGHCAGCHGAIDQLEEYENSATEIPLTGGFAFDIPPGHIVVPNITQDEKTGIGGMSDGEIARALRHGVGRDGTMLFPIMPFRHVADDDLTAIISYLRTVEPVEKQQEPTQLSMLGKILYAYVVEPGGPTEPVPESVTPGPTVEYGKYLGESVANCHGCHTNRDLATGEVIGPKLGGGLELEHRGKVFVIPNITQGNGSRVNGWEESAFIARVRTGKPSAPGSPMPWAPLSKLSDDDLRALWKYLNSVDPVDNDTGPSLKEES